MEISDLIVDVDPVTLARRPVDKREVVERFRRAGNRRAARIVDAMPSTDGRLDDAYVDALLVRVHAEMQRISEEFQHGHRVLELLRPLIAACREAGGPPPYRVVDIGCGTGFVIRWLAAHGGLGPDVDLLGVDIHGALVEAAQRLADREGLPARFEARDAFRIPEAATVYISTGVLHHFRGPDLVRVFAQHDRPGTFAMAHFDFQPSPFAAAGSWLFHAARMREPLARHDGVLSARRAHSGSELVRAAREGSPAFSYRIYSSRLWGLPIPRAFHCLLGVRPGLLDPLGRHLGRRRGRLADLP